MTEAKHTPGPWELYRKYKMLAVHQRQRGDYDDASDCEELAEMHRRAAIAKATGAV